MTAPSRLRFWVAAALVLAALGELDTLAQLPMWRDTPALATVNLVMSLAWILTGLLLSREDGQRGVAWALYGIQALACGYAIYLLVKR